MIVVRDTSPMIALAHLELLHALGPRFAAFIIPPAVDVAIRQFDGTRNP